MRGGITAAISAAIRLGALTVLAGCAEANDPAKVPATQDLNPHAVNDSVAPAASDEGTRVITNLSQLSSAPSGIPSISAQNLVSGAAALHDTAPSPNEAQKLADTNLEHLYLSKERSAVHGGEAGGAGDRMLLNAKARQFPEFSYALLNQTLVA